MGNVITINTKEKSEWTRSRVSLAKGHVPALPRAQRGSRCREDGLSVLCPLSLSHRYTRKELSAPEQPALSSSVILVSTDVGEKQDHFTHIKFYVFSSDSPFLTMSVSYLLFSLRPFKALFGCLTTKCGLAQVF